MDRSSCKNNINTMSKQLLMKTPKQVVIALAALLFLFLLAGLLAMSFPNLNEQLAESAKHPSWDQSPTPSPESSTAASETTSASDAHSEPVDSSAQSAPGAISMLASWFEGKPLYDVIGDAAARRLLVPGVKYTGYKVTNNYTRHIEDEIYHVYDLDVSYDPIPGACGPKESGTKEKTIAFVKRGNSWYWYYWSEPGMYDEVLSALGAGR